MRRQTIQRKKSPNDQQSVSIAPASRSAAPAALSHDAIRTPDAPVEAETELSPADEQAMDAGLLGHDFGAIRVMHAGVQRSATAPPPPPDEPTELTNAEWIGATASGVARGEPLPPGLKAMFERSLGADLNDVEVHRGPTSARAAGALGALAFTIGRDIHVGTGSAPDDTSVASRWLLAHEVAHVVQQRDVNPGHGASVDHVGLESDPAERDADLAADSMAFGRPAPLSLRGAVSPGVVMRKPITVEGIGTIDPDGPTPRQQEEQKRLKDEYDKALGMDPALRDIKSVNYKANAESFAAAGALPAAPMPKAAIYVPPTAPVKVNTGRQIPSLIPGVEPLPEQRQAKLSPYHEHCWAAYGRNAARVEAIWNTATGPLDRYFIATKEISREMQDEIGLPVRSTNKETVAETVDKAGAGGKGIEIDPKNEAEVQAIGKIGEKEDVKKALEAQRGKISLTQAAYGGVRSGAGGVQAAADQLLKTKTLTDLESLEAKKKEDETALQEAKGKAGELKGHLSTLASISTAFVAAAEGDPSKLAGMAAEAAYDQILNAVYWKEVEAATKALKETQKKIAGAKAKLPGYDLSISTGEVEKAVGHAQEARGKLKNALSEERKAAKDVAQALKGHAAKTNDPGEKARLQQLAKAMEALPKAKVVASHADACASALSADIPYSEQAGVGFAIATQIGDGSAEAMRTALGWIVSGRSRLKPDAEEWKGRVAKLEMILHALENKELGSD